MLANPLQQSPLKPDVVAQSLGLQPLVAENLLPLRQKLLIER
jgi:hypothetical protein